MSKCFNGLSVVNVELTSRCNKESCYMCGRRKVDREYPEIKMNYGDMDFNLVKKLARQIPKDIVIQFHNNGEPLLYPRFGEAINLFKDNIKHINTNGKLIVEKADEIISNLDTMTISLFKDDSEQDKQYDLVQRFLNIKGERKPLMIYRCLGVFDYNRWKKLPGILITRVMHSPMGSFDYEKRVTKPEIGICLDLLSHLVISKDGLVSPCVRFDPNKLGIIGDVNLTPLVDIWNGSERRIWIENHLRGKRKNIPLCSTCDFWGCPTGY